MRLENMNSSDGNLSSSLKNAFLIHRSHDVFHVLQLHVQFLLQRGKKGYK
jgi:hypothetical protein